MYKEYRDVTLNGAVLQMYMEMSSRHRIRQDNKYEKFSIWLLSSIDPCVQLFHCRMKPKEMLSKGITDWIL